MPFSLAAAAADVDCLTLMVADAFGKTILREPPECEPSVPLPEPAISDPPKPEAATQQLGNSPGGRQFLAVAAVIVATVGADNGGSLLHEILETTCDSRESDMVPQCHHVTKLLEVISTVAKPTTASGEENPSKPLAFKVQTRLYGVVDFALPFKDQTQLHELFDSKDSSGVIKGTGTLREFDVVVGRV